MKITKISISNFLKLKDVDFNPTATNVIVGKNQQGKTSILKAIRTAFTGDADSTSIRIGEHKAEITLELEDLTIHRSITEKGNNLKVSNKEGMTYPAPQKFLDGIVGQFSFNPIAFFDKKATERKKYLLEAIDMRITPEELTAYTGEKLTGLDFDKHALEVVEDVRKFYYDKRTIANAEKSKKEKALADLNDSIPADFNPTEVSDEALQNLRDAIAKDDVEKAKQVAHAEKVATLQKREKEIMEQIAGLQTTLEGVQNEVLEALAVTFDVSDDLALAAAKETLAVLEGKRELVFTAKRRDEVRSEYDAAFQEAARLDGVVKALSKDVPEDLIAKAELPVEGLSIVGDDILVNGVSIDNMSSSEQLTFGLNIARSLNKDFKIICVDGLELLDSESFEFFLKEAEKSDFQMFVTRVDGNSPHSIVIEDGEIKA